jgi:hypothetical protein
MSRPSGLLRKDGLSYAFNGQPLGGASTGRWGVSEAMDKKWVGEAAKTRINKKQTLVHPGVYPRPNKLAAIRS